MQAVFNFLDFLNSNWTMIVAIATLLFALYLKIKSTINRWMKMSEEEKQKELEEQIKKAKQAIANYILSLVASAEVDWEGTGLGPIKRAQVIEKIYKEYPVLLDVVDQEDVIKFIDENIEIALETVREKIRKEIEDQKDEKY